MGARSAPRALAWRPSRPLYRAGQRVTYSPDSATYRNHPDLNLRNFFLIPQKINQEDTSIC